MILLSQLTKKFQHTATRRWLPEENGITFSQFVVSTHSHPKVAACDELVPDGFGGQVSTHSHPKVAALSNTCTQRLDLFQHTATRRWLR